MLKVSFCNFNKVMRILIIEDEDNLAKLLKKGLENDGYVVDRSADGYSGQKQIELNNKDYDIIILDLMLPKKSGFEVCKDIRSSGINTPVLILTAKSDVESKVFLLDSGADDYMIKPFVFSELLARIRALTRRPEPILSSELKVADLLLNLNSKKLFRNGNEINLTLKEFRLLEYFMRRPDMLIKRVDLTDNVWDFYHNSFSNTLDVYISRLREKIDKGRKQGLIETVRGTGYKFRSS